MVFSKLFLMRGNYSYAVSRVMYRGEYCFQKDSQFTHHFSYRSIWILDWVCIFSLGMKSAHPHTGSYIHPVLSLG